MNPRIASALVPIAAALAACGPAKPGGKPCTQQLAAGDLVITEVMPDPDGADEGKEWIEIHNATDREIDLSQLQLQMSKADGSGVKVHVFGGAKVGPRKYLVAGGVLDAAKPAYVGYAYGSDFGTGLPNGSGIVQVSCGDTLIDKVLYADVKGDKGMSRQLDGKAAPDAIGNDDLTRWCDGVTPFDDGDNNDKTLAFGTPGAANDTCGGVVVVMGMCKDKGTGMMRPVVPPTAGQLVISEIMANPSAANMTLAEADAEWFELYATATFDLNGLATALSADVTKMKAVKEFAVADCLSVDAGAFVLLLKNKDVAKNGGLPAMGTQGTFDYSLTNTGTPTLAIAAGGVIVDSVTYKAPTDASTQLDPGRLDSVANDDLGSWCPATMTYGPAGKGTPGAANESCNIIAPGQCVDGGVARDKAVPAAGDLYLTELMPNPFGTETSNEWLELTAVVDVDLAGLQIGTTLASLAKIPEGACHRLAAGQSIVFARDPSLAASLGLPALEPWQKFTFSLGNNSGTAVLAVEGAAIDMVMWPSFAADAAQGRTYARDPGDPGKWCMTAADAGVLYFTDAMMQKSYGTPGAANPACP